MARKKSKRVKQTTANDTGKRSSHKNEALYKWEEKNMEGALSEFMDQKNKPSSEQLTIRKLTEAWSVPNSTLRRRILGACKVAQRNSGRKTVC